MAQYVTAVQRTNYVLEEADLPTQWDTIQADLQRAPMKRAESREKIIKNQIILRHECAIWVEPER